MLDHVRIELYPEFPCFTLIAGHAHAISPNAHAGHHARRLLKGTPRFTIVAALAFLHHVIGPGKSSDLENSQPSPQ
jgi:hypothetical protein